MKISDIDDDQSFDKLMACQLKLTNIYDILDMMRKSRNGKELLLEVDPAIPFPTYEESQKQRAESEEKLETDHEKADKEKEKHDRELTKIRSDNQKQREKIANHKSDGPIYV